MPLASKLIEFIPDRLFYATASGSMQDDSEHHYFSTDNTLVYQAFEADFGPLNIGQTYAFFAQLSAKLKDPNLKSKRLVYISAPGYNFRANSITLIGLFLVVVLNKPPAQVSKIVQQIQPALTPYRDASMGPCTYGVTVQDILFAAQRAMQSKIFSLNSFKYDDYYFYSQVENGDLTYIIPDKILAIAGPVSQTHPFFKYHPFTPSSYIPLFKSRQVTAVVRLNEACYNRADFIKSGIHHYDLPYPDGSIPTERIIKEFLKIIDTEQGAVAVHCKAGLGRTGTLIGIWMMREYGYTAREVIAWLRVCRPGSVLGQQQQFLIAYEQRMRERGEIPEANPESSGQQPTKVQQQRVDSRQSGRQSAIGARENQQGYISQQQQQMNNNIQNAQNANQYMIQQSARQQQQSAFSSPSKPVFSSGRNSSLASPNRTRTPLQSKTMTQGRQNYSVKTPTQNTQKLNYGFGTNGRVHPDVVQTPSHVLDKQLLPGISQKRGGSGKISDW
eukprot:EST46947.1 Dual specificity phosphatase [Spironucleus salmonicida]